MTELAVTRFFIPRFFTFSLGTLVVSLAVIAASAATPKRVLILNPHGRDVEPFSSAVSAFRSTLSGELGAPVDFYEIPLDLARFTSPDAEEPLVAFLEELITDVPMDLLVPVGGSGSQFADRHRSRLFPTAPVLLLTGDPRLIPSGFQESNTNIITQTADLHGMVEDILLLRPKTKRIAVVFGASPLENFWVNECRREFQPFEDRIEFIWLNELPLDEIIETCRSLPPDSFILHGLYVEDIAGISSEKNEAIRRLHESANAPLFGYFESELGLGIIGGQLYQNSKIGELGAHAAVRILRGEKQENIPVQILEPSEPRYDWRELRRWNISEKNLPEGSIVEFGEPGFWAQYRWWAVGAIVFGIFQTFLIVGLIVNRAKWRKGEAEAVLIADISSKFVNLPSDEVDREILEAQRRLCEFLDLDAIALWQWEGHKAGHFVATHAYSLQSGPLPVAEMSEADFPWVKEQMLARRIILLSSLDDLPAEAARDRGGCEAAGIKSNLTLPLNVGVGPPVGLLAMNSIRKARSWPQTFVKRMELVAQIFANALARKRTEQILRESELRQSLAAAAADAGLWELDLSSGVFWTSEKAQAIFEYSAEEIVDMGRFRERVHPEDWPRVESVIEDAVTKLRIVDVEFRICREDGRERWIVAMGRPLLNAKGGGDRLTGLSFDITERRQAEIEVRKLRDDLAHIARVTLLGQLASALAHELSQPLGAILRNAEAAEIMLREPSPDLGELRAIVADILRDDHRAGEVIDRLRSLLKRRSLDPQTVELRQVIDEVLSLIRFDAATRQVRIEFIDEPALLLVRGDRIHLQQVLLNLFINAMDALDECLPDQRTIRLEVCRASPDFVQVRVLDNGPGVPAESLEQLFEPFFSSKTNGMGIGLAVSRTIIEAQQGKIWAENGPEGGACFCFTVPVADLTEHSENS